MIESLSSTPFSEKAAARRRALSFLVVALGAGRAFAQGDLPAGRVVTWVVPYPPGGTTDVLGRSIAQRLTQALGTQVIVDNKPGATGTIGAAFVARATPDGTTLLGTSIGPQAIAPHLMGKLPYDPIAGFEPVIIVGSVPHLLVVGSGQPFRRVADLVAAGKAKPGRARVRLRRKRHSPADAGRVAQAANRHELHPRALQGRHARHPGHPLEAGPVHVCSRRRCHASCPIRHGFAPWRRHLPGGWRRCRTCRPWLRRV